MTQNKQTDLSKRLRELAVFLEANKCVTLDMTDHSLIAQAAEEIERYYGGMINWKKTAEEQQAGHALHGRLTLGEADRIRRLASDLETTGRITSLSKGDSKAEFMSQNRKVQCALEDVLSELTSTDFVTIPRKTYNEMLNFVNDKDKAKGWIDEFGNVFPLGAYSPNGKPSWSDADKRGWKPLYKGTSIKLSSIPDGWKLVPIVPTPKMVDATFNDRPNEMESHNKRNKRIYAAMIDAAPNP